MKYLTYFIILTLAVGCTGGRNQPSQGDTTSVTSTTKNDTNGSTGNKLEIVPSLDDEFGKKIYFLGHYIICGKNLGKELERISSEDGNIQYDKNSKNLTIYGTTFHVNHSESQPGFMLLSSVQPESSQIKKVIEGISKYHGKEECEEPEHYSWLPYLDRSNAGKNYPIIHLRRVRSEEGGTVISVM